MIKKAYAGMTAMVCLLSASGSYADQPMPWQATLQPAATPIMRDIHWFEQYTLWFIVPVTLFVLALLIIVCLRFRASANPVPSKTSHNTAIEIAWTVGPVLVLLFLAVPSFNLLTAQLTLPENPDVTIKATATQWQWNYEYEGSGDNPLAFDSYLLKDQDRAAAGKEDKAKYPRLLAVDNELVKVNAGTQIERRFKRPAAVVAHWRGDFRPAIEITGEVDVIGFGGKRTCIEDKVVRVGMRRCNQQKRQNPQKTTKSDRCCSCVHLC